MTIAAVGGLADGIGQPAAVAIAVEEVDIGAEPVIPVGGGFQNALGVLELMQFELGADEAFLLADFFEAEGLVGVAVGIRVHARNLLVSVADPSFFERRSGCGTS